MRVLSLLFVLLVFLVSVANPSMLDTAWAQSNTGGEEDTSDSEETSGPDPSFIENSFLMDVNGDGVVDIKAFGDSNTRGTGDFTPVGAFVETPVTPAGEAGYPLRIESTLGIPVDNSGRPGEQVLGTAVPRFSSEVQADRPDLVVISGGDNDAIRAGNSRDLRIAFQTMINIAFAVGTQPVMMTNPPPCCNHSGLRPFVNAYNSTIRSIAVDNSIPLADVSHAFANTCNLGDCHLLNRPEGAHPNIAGYSVMAETVIATLLKIDLFAPDGPATLAHAVGLPVEAILTQPDPDTGQ